MDLPKYKPVVSIIPGGCLQYLDFEFDLEKLGRIRKYFREEKLSHAAEPNQRVKHKLHCLEYEDESGQYVDRETNQPSDYDYDVDGKKALAVFMEKWVPVPFLRIKAEKWDVDMANKFERGPSNWARCRIVQCEDVAERYRVVLVFDTACEDRSPGSDSYVALSGNDVEENAHFRLAYHERDNGWFLNLGWIDDWLNDVYHDQPKFRKGRSAHADDNPYVLEHLSYYLTFLDVLQKSAIFPTIRVIDPSHVRPIDVDLVLDLGNSRTTGILIETLPQKATNLNDSYLLQIRDLKNPEFIYTDPFETRIEFSEVSFGNARLSARSGRHTPAFIWPSVVRIGIEAARLSLHAVCAEGSTGMSSPKRYLWDERVREQEWRYNGQYPDGQIEPPVCRGVFIQNVNKEGTPLCCIDDPLFKRSPILRKQPPDPAFEGRFTRSSIMMFLLSEVIMHALLTINSPAQRSERENPDIPRRLRRIIFTVPTAMPIAEQRIYRRWVKWAVRIIWKTLGWSEWCVNTVSGVKQNELLDYRMSPDIRCDWDEATCTQLVYLYNELTEKYQGDAHHFFRLAGRCRDGYGENASVRVANIDIGGGTTDLSIATFELLGDESTAARIKPHLEFRDGFNIAGDDVLCGIIEKHILPAIAKAIAQNGIADTRKTMGQLFGRDVIGRTQESRVIRGQFARQICVPLAIEMMRIYENAELMTGSEACSRTLESFFGSANRPSQKVIDYFNAEIKKLSGNDFDIMNVELRVDPRSIGYTVKNMLGQILDNLAEVIYLYDCDLLLLTGRPSKWHAIIASLFSKLPVPADRIIPMRDFRIGSWYPFADSLGHIIDPKTTVVVGAILCALAEGHLEGFSFDTSSLKLKSTARFIGEMDITGQIKRPRVWFQVDVDNPGEMELKKTISFAGPLSIGFRQLEAERWTTTRLYLLDFTPDAKSNTSKALPYEIELSFKVAELDDSSAMIDRDEGELIIENVVDATGAGRMKDVEIRLQTLSEVEGYWLDTGIFNIV